MSRLSVGLLVSSIASVSFAAQAGQFAQSASDYVRGTVDSGYESYTQTSAAIGRPKDVAGEGVWDNAYMQIESVFNPHWTQDEIVAVGVGGKITFSFAAPIPVTGKPIIGLYTNIAFNDPVYGSATVSSQADTLLPPGVARTAIVEVADGTGTFHSLGRLVLDVPSNTLASGSDAYAVVPQPTDLRSDYTKPFVNAATGEARQRMDFAGMTYTQAITLLDGSAGGSWLTVPTGMGLTEVTAVRISEPLWRLAENVYADTRPADYGAPGSTYAAVYVDTIAAVPEPTIGMAILGLTSLGLVRRRRAM